MVKEISIDQKNEVKQIFLDVFIKDPWNDMWQDELQINNYLDDLMDNKNSLSMGFFKDNKMIGISLGYIFHWWEDNEYYIKEFCIQSDSQNMGYGSIFLQELGEFLLAREIRAITLTTDRNVSAYNFYRKNGFIELDSIVFLAKILN